MQLSLHVEAPILDAMQSAAPSAIIDLHLTRAMTFMREKIVGDIKNEMHFAHPTGNLESSIHAEPASADPRSNWVGTSVEYGPFVNYGTGRRGAASGMTPPDGYVYGPRPGMMAQPFMEPAFQQAQGAVQQAFATELQLALQELTGGG